jgi:hypothetical protein
MKQLPIHLVKTGDCLCSRCSSAIYVVVKIVKFDEHPTYGSAFDVLVWQTLGKLNGLTQLEFWSNVAVLEDWEFVNDDATNR